MKSFFTFERNVFVFLERFRTASFAKSFCFIANFFYWSLHIKKVTVLELIEIALFLDFRLRALGVTTSVLVLTIAYFLRLSLEIRIVTHYLTVSMGLIQKVLIIVCHASTYSRLPLRIAEVAFFLSLLYQSDLSLSILR